jgi:hypothetical protein
VFIAHVANLIEGHRQNVPSGFSVSLSTHDVGIAAHANRSVTKAFFDKRHLDPQRCARLDPLWIKE